MLIIHKHNTKPVIVFHIGYNDIKSSRCSLYQRTQTNIEYSGQVAEPGTHCLDLITECFSICQLFPILDDPFINIILLYTDDASKKERSSTHIVVTSLPIM